MKILHLSESGMPDWRIIKSAISAKRLGHEVIFAGKISIGGKPPNYTREIFSKIYDINWTYRAKLIIPFFWHSVKKRVQIIIKETKPDIIHAHNILSAKIASESGVPFVYDDHEYWPIYIKTLSESHTWHVNIMQELRRRALIIRRKQLIAKLTKWQKELVLACPTIVTTNKVAEELKEISAYNDSINNKLFVVPNFPAVNEVKDFEKPCFHNALSSVYAGRDIQGENTRPHRNLHGLTDIFVSNDIGDLVMIGVEGRSPSSAKVRYLGFLDKQCMYYEMFKHSIGLMAFRKHWSHKYKSPNKAYEYAHAGLFTICTSSFSTVIDDFKGNCAIFEDYTELASQLKHFQDDIDGLYQRRLRAFQFARQNLIWENYEKNIFHAYRLA